MTIITLILLLIIALAILTLGIAAKLLVWLAYIVLITAVIYFVSMPFETSIRKCMRKWRREKTRRAKEREKWMADYNTELFRKQCEREIADIERERPK